MLLRLLSRLALRALLVFLAATSVVVGCSRQGEGERCDFAANEHADCDDGLVCRQCSELAERLVNRCCPPGDPLQGPCALSKTPGAVCLGSTASGSGGSAGSGTAGTAGTAGSSNGGTAGVEEQPAGAGGA